MWGELLERSSPPRPLQELSNKNHPKKVVTERIDRRLVRNARFCYRKRSGTAKTLPVKKVVGNMKQPTVVSFFLCFFLPIYIFLCYNERVQSSV